MKSKRHSSSIRVFGQRSIPSTFRHLPRNPSEGSAINQEASRKSKTPHLSLSQLLDCRSQNSSTPPRTVPGKSTPFLSPLCLKTPRGEKAGVVKQVEEQKSDASGSDDKVIFEGFKHTEEDKVDFVSQIDIGQLENSLVGDIQESKKRKHPFEGGDENQSVRKHVVVLGGETRLKPKGQIGNDSSNKKPRPLYNHYANGRGWWDHDMEGVDNEELGFSEVWEGVGSTTLGGIIDWH
ncbi:hypothetical protein RJT34_23579 [Clitoria ternatea]|uniref:Uncharacterized protein n=1 Tax=Clitoria ternatea TaxID=43366 RepID=A0AAN9FLG8_CLITE